MGPKQSQIDRFGGEIGEIILGEGPGGGLASYPWALDDYERVLDLSPAEAWLLKRLIKQVWKEGSLAYPSMRKISRQAKVSRPTLNRLINNLCAKGLITRSIRENGDRRHQFSMDGYQWALALCIVCDPGSSWCKQGHEPWSMAEAKKLARQRQVRMRWDVLGETTGAA